MSVELRRSMWPRRATRCATSALALTQALCSTAMLVLFALPASSPASAQFMCTTTPSDINCTNSGTAPTPFTNSAAVTNQNATTTNSGTANGFASQTTGGGNATATNSGSNINNGMLAQTVNGGNATATNSGTDTNGNVVAQTFTTGNATASNSGSIGNVNSLDFSFLQARALGSGNAAASNSGSVAGGIAAATLGGGTATANNSGTTPSSLVALTTAGGDATASNIGVASGIAAVTIGTGNATVTNSGVSTSTGTISAGGLITLAGGIAAIATSGNATVVNSGSSTNPGGAALLASATGNATVINSGIANGGIDVIANGTATLTNIVGGRVIGPINLGSLTNNAINFQGGNWLFTIATAGPSTTINTNGAPFVVAGSFGTMSGVQVAVLDPTTFALADRSLTNFTGEISEMLQGRFDGMSAGGGGSALGFAGAPSSAVADQAQAAFSGIPSVAMSYASSASRPVIGKAPAAAAPYYDTTVWASGFGGERKQRADGVVLPTTDTAFGGAMGVDRILGGNLRLGAFVGAGSSREEVELSVQKIDATYVFGGAYGRFDWISQHLDFSLHGGGINNKSTRTIANNSVGSGIETATASYGGWFISPEVTYGYRIPFNAITVTPRVRLRYVGGQLDGYSESGSMQNLSVGRRSINDLEERGEVELSTVSGALKASATVGIIGLERLGNPNINTVLLGQNLSFVTAGQASAFGGVFGMHLEYRAMPNVSLFVAGEATAMSDKSDSFAASGGARVSF
ncbi:MAG TPA: autotransporter domain-containing protein [Xanthobacteraceae bacterium]|nr:autotransporter domain-containing protein [Xanthobacteraceae bacterium]